MPVHGDGGDGNGGYCDQHVVSSTLDIFTVNLQLKIHSPSPESWRWSPIGHRNNSSITTSNPASICWHNQPSATRNYPSQKKHHSFLPILRRPTTITRPRRCQQSRRLWSRATPTAAPPQQRHNATTTQRKDVAVTVFESEVDNDDDNDDGRRRQPSPTL